MKSEIVIKKNGPFKVKGLKELIDSSGKNIQTKSNSLCRCGESGKMPYCDNTHIKIKFSDKKLPDRVKDRVVEYNGKNIIITDNRGVCSHDGACFRNLPKVFRIYEKLWIRPDEASVEDIIKTIEKCPSGALSYSLNGVRYQNVDRKPIVKITKSGPLKVAGYVILKDNNNSEPESKEHYVLCRCGKSKNKPFCDGSHLKKRVGSSGFLGQNT